MWNLPRPGIKPVSPALADRFFTIGPPGNSPMIRFLSPTMWGPCGPVPPSQQTWESCVMLGARNTVNKTDTLPYDTYDLVSNK